MTGTCIGACCQAFCLGSISPDVLPEAAREYNTPKDAETLLGMLVPLGSWSKNPKHSVAGDPPGEPQEGPGGWFYSCRRQDPSTLRCTIYDRRPAMCRKFPNGRKCPYEGCTFDGRDPQFAQLLDEVQRTSGGRFSDFAQFDSWYAELKTTLGRSLSPQEFADVRFLEPDRKRTPDELPAHILTLLEHDEP